MASVARWMGAVVLCYAGLAAAEAPQPADWPQWRGPNRDGMASNSPKLLDAWPKEGPPLLWKSEWIPACEEGGCSSPVVADGKVFIYATAKVPIAPGKPYQLITPEFLSDAGWHPDLPDALAEKIEAAWASKDRPASTGWEWWKPEKARDPAALDAFLAQKPDLAKFIADFCATLSPAETGKYGAYIRKRLCIDTPRNKWGVPNGATREQLAKLGKLRETRLPTYRMWARELQKIGINDWLSGNAWSRAFTWTDTVICLDAATGRERWRKVIPVDLKELPKDPGVQWWCFTPGGGNSVQPIGACATPAVSGGKCVAAGIMGLYCFSAADGTLLWQVKGPPEHASPVVAGGLVYHVGCAYELATGKLAWKSQFWDGKHKRYESGPRYSSPLLVAVGGRPHVLTSDLREDNTSSFCCLDLETGKPAWTFKSPIGGMLDARGELLVVPPLYGSSGTKVYKLTPAGPELLWKKNYPGGSGHIHQGHLYIPSAVFTCVDLATGEFNWKKSLHGGVAECSTTVLADGKIFTPRGECHQLTKNYGDLTYALAMVRATPEKYEELGSFNPKMCMMTSPALAGGLLYLRTLEGVSCYDLREHGPYLDAVTATKDALTFRFKQTGGGLAAAAPQTCIQLADAAGTRPARMQINGDELTVDVKDAAAPFSLSCAAGALTDKNGRPVAAFGWSEARQLKFRKGFDRTIMLTSELPLQQDGRWNNPAIYAVSGAKVTQVELDAQGKGVSLITDKTWKAGEALTISHPSYPVGMGESRCGTINATIAEPQRAAAKFVKVDETTAGNWKGVYGAEGAVICADKGGVAPSCALVSVQNKTDGIPWAPNPGDPRYLLKSVATPERTVSSWHAPEQFEINIEFTDGKEHQVALYCMAWNKHCDMSVEVLDGDTRAVLDTQPVKDFVKGKYLIWNLKGQAIIRLSSNVQQEGTAALASGLFIDSAGAGK